MLGGKEATVVGVVIVLSSGIGESPNGWIMVCGSMAVSGGPVGVLIFLTAIVTDEPLKTDCDRPFNILSLRMLRPCFCSSASDVSEQDPETVIVPRSVNLQALAARLRII